MNYSNEKQSEIEAYTDPDKALFRCNQLRAKNKEFTVMGILGDGKKEQGVIIEIK